MRRSVQISEHAVERYRERVRDCSDDEAIEHIARVIAHHERAILESRELRIRIGKHSWVFKHGHLATILPARRVKSAGRPKKGGKDRYDSGTIIKQQRGETEEERLATVRAQREKLVGSEHWRDQLAGTWLGRFRLAGREYEKADQPTGLSAYGISAVQFDAGVAFQKLAGQYARVCDSPPRHPVGVRIPTAQDTAPVGDPPSATSLLFNGDYEPEFAEAIKARYDAVIEAVREAGRHEGRGDMPWKALMAACIDDRVPTGEIRRMFIPDLRTALNAANRVLKGFTG